MVGSPAPGARFVDPAVLARVGNLEFVARSVVDGVINGLHRSPFFGASVDFAEHRGYVPGDDIRRVDWKVFARTDRFFLKEFEADSNANFSVLFDISKSMAFGSRLSKLDYGKTLAACLTYLVHQQRDRVGLVTFDHAVVDHVPASAKHLDVVLHTLDRARAERPGDFEPPLKKLAEHFGRRGIIVVISDFYAEPDVVFQAVAPLRFRGNDVILFHVLDPAEVEFPFTDPSAFEDLESGDQLPVVPEALSDQYRALVKAHIDELSSRATAQRMDYKLLQTSMPLDHALFQYFVDPRPADAHAMTFLTPLFLLGLAALAIPVLVHLTQRERTTVVEFPSLMFLKKIPYESVKRRRLRDLLLLALRAAAMALIVAAFARPFMRGSELVASAGGARELVVLLDRSYSMGAGDTWARAQQAARQAVQGLSGLDRVSLVLFGSSAELVLRSSADVSRVVAEIDRAQPSSSATRYAPALKVASSVLAESSLPRKEAVLVSDFQRAGWQADEAFRLPGGAVFTPVAVEPPAGTNLTVTPIAVQRLRVDNQDRVVITGGVTNRGGDAVTNVRLDLEVDGRVVQSQTVAVAAGSSAAAAFAPLTVPPSGLRVAARLPADALAADNAFHAVLAPPSSVSVLLTSSGNRGDADLYLTRALAIGDRPRFTATSVQVDALSTDTLARTRVVLLQDLPLGDALAARLKTFVDGGGGLVVALGPRATLPQADWLPATVGNIEDRSRGAAAKLSGFDYGHAVFEPFRAPRSGDFSTTRIYGFRSLTARPSAATLARFDGGTPALVEGTSGRGRVLVWATTLDLSWSDLALKPVYLPFVHQLVRQASGYREEPGWVTVGQAIDVGAAGASAVVLSPRGQRLSPPEGASALEVAEAGFYDVRGAREGESLRLVASNVDLSESDLTRVDPSEVSVAVTGQPVGDGAGGPATAIPDDVQEQAQRIWWYLLFAGILLLIAESWLARRLAPARL